MNNWTIIEAINETIAYFIKKKHKKNCEWIIKRLKKENIFKDNEWFLLKRDSQVEQDIRHTFLYKRKSHLFDTSLS